MDLFQSKKIIEKNELRSRTEFEYDRFGNVEREINTYNINEGKVNDISNLKLQYNDSLLISKEFSFGITEKYSDFNKLGKPKQIEKIEQTKFKAFPLKELIEYDNKGNITKSTKFSIYEDLNGKIINETATTYYKYNKNELWTKKYKTVNGKEHLVAKRTYK